MFESNNEDEGVIEDDNINYVSEEIESYFKSPSKYVFSSGGWGKFILDYISFWHGGVKCGVNSNIFVSYIFFVGTWMQNIAPKVAVAICDISYNTMIPKCITWYYFLLCFLTHTQDIAEFHYVLSS